MISKYQIRLFLGMLYCFSAYASDSKEMKPFKNEFFFKLTDEKWLISVQKRAKYFNFAFKETLFPELHLFRKTDLPMLNRNAVSEEKITIWMNTFGTSVEYIEQDKFEQIYPILEGNNMYRSDAEGRAEKLRQATGKTNVKCSRSPSFDCEQGRASTHKCKNQVRIAVLDAYFDTNHQNLQCNIMIQLAHNLVEGNNDLKPINGFPDELDEYMNTAQSSDIFNHGTMCMGRIASSAEHGCNKGGDTSAQIIPLKFIGNDGWRSIVNEIEALKYRANEIDIYSCSYGLGDNVGFPKSQKVSIEDALAKGVNEGRNCKGSIYLFPSGNGHGNGKLDNCNTDIYAKSTNTITIASVTMSYEISEETEICPAALVATFGTPDPFRGLFMNTTIPRDKCTSNFRGTSAATAYAAGLISHALRENRNFSKRDIEHMLVQTSDKGFDLKNIQWRTNGAGYKFNERIGFGVINVTALKIAAENWTHVPEKRVCRIERQSLFTNISNRQHFTKAYGIKSDNCRNTTQFLRYLEHVELALNISCINISKVNLKLISPMGTTITLLTTITVNKDNQVKYENFRWSFMTVQLWGENPEGDWILQVAEFDNLLGNIEIRIQSLTLHGTENHPSLGGSMLECTPKSVANVNATPSTPKSGLKTELIVVIILVAVLLPFSIVLVVCYIRKRNINCWPVNQNPHQRNPKQAEDPASAPLRKH